MDTHYHIWFYRRAPDGTIRSMERDGTIFPTRRKANYALSDGRQYWKAGQVLQCVDGAFCQPLPEEMVDRNVPFGPSTWQSSSWLSRPGPSGLRPSTSWP